MRQLELLAPAKNLECGIAAIDHGADAVYIGAQRFGARAAAGNSLDDIESLVNYAHQFQARVYVTVNTIIYDDEIDETRTLLSDLKRVGVDAILVQDMSLLQIADGLTLHASTQTDNRSAEKVRWLMGLGFQRVVLARELSITEIAEIHRQVPEAELEVFVHGALCVSYSGLCYASQACFGRSANRGECAQFCRMKFDLVDADGREWIHQRHLLSLKDMCQAENLERLANAGATSFKIEGRLKDVAYVKNVTAAYSNMLNELIAQHPDLYERASKGHCTYTFKPDLQKTFNRGYTTYFANGRRPDIASFDTPKAIGEYVGTVKEIRRNSLSVAGLSSFSNGDGLCFINAKKELEGFRVNRVEGNRLFPLKMPVGVQPGLRLFRNSDQELERLLSRPSAERKISVTMSLRATAQGFVLRMDEVEAEATIAHVVAEKPQRDNVIRQLTKLGGTPYTCSEIDIPSDFNFFIPSSQLAELRRAVVAKRQSYALSKSKRNFEPLKVTFQSYQSYSRNYFYNISNHLSRQFYASQDIETSPAFELLQPEDAVIMQCRHCLRYALGFCVKNGGQRPSWKEPLRLRLGDGREFPIEFDCKQCQMNIYTHA